MAALKRFVIERDIPGIGGKALPELGSISAASNAALAQAGLQRVQWQHSYVTEGKTFCVYLAESEDAIREHAKIGGFPATSIYQDFKTQWPFNPDSYLGYRGPDELETVTGNRLWEWFSVGRWGTKGYNFKEQAFDGKQWPEDLGAEFRSVSLDFQAKTHAVAIKILKSLWIGLGRDPADLNEVDPEITREEVEALKNEHGRTPPRLHAHADMDVLTVLFNRVGDVGLEIAPGAESENIDTIIEDVGNIWNHVPVAKEWTPLDPKPGCLTVNVGDGLTRWTDGILKSTYHRVRAPKEGDPLTARYSIPYFLNPKLRYAIQGPQKRWAPVTGFDLLSKTGNAYAARKNSEDKSWQEAAYNAEVADLTADGLSAYLLAKNGVHQPAKGNGAGAKKGSGSREPAIKAQALPATHAPRSAAGPHLALIDILLIEFLQQLLQSGSALSFGAARADMARSVLDDLGEEVTGIVAPVSLCMALTVVLVRILNPDGDSDSSAVFLASAYYNEQEGDTTGQKLSGAVINALIFVGVVAVMTFVLVLLFKYGCVRVIYAYMGLAGFSIFFVLAGIIALELLQHWHVHLDFISFSYILFNFAMVGSLTLFFMPAPLLMKQSYLIITGIVTAYVFTWVPEWTTWVLLLAMALYDVLAVLLPGGPLKMLVELAQEREETIPALVYEARPSRRAEPVPPDMRPVPAAALAHGDGPAVAALQQEPPSRSAAAPPGQAPSIRRDSVASTASVGGSSSQGPEPTPHTPLIPPSLGSTPAADSSHFAQPPSEAAAAQQQQQQQQRSSRQGTPPAHGAAQGPVGLPPAEGEREEDDDESVGFDLPDSIKLGLGDFIFYSVLVGRAAMYDFLTVFACYLAIVAGLGCTLLWLAMARKALPALPISIVLAVSFYFISRFVMEPVILPMTLQLAYF
ncbi:presenilin isoform B [Micractinium conductrix]|uniref:Presenilin n=1 Tax=Micractinium conductrix TaxID=554055 RepID=A0A2P6VQX2_9CHLO|nr:presenilin isoform B [Micractinium conductrix]|eukprot:PSC76470.1 presenilin isoform B [Micractinium conductrix]